MTNREYMIHCLSRDDTFDDCGASEEACVYYNVNCPYFDGDERALCEKEKTRTPLRKMCVECKTTWLDSEVDE